MLHTKAVEPGTLEVLRKLCTEAKLDKFALMGGTNLALRLGHRKSEDLDFFSVEKFNENELDTFMNETYAKVERTHTDEQTRQYLVSGVKVEFIRFNYPLLDKVEVLEGIRMYSLKDTVAAKLSAICQRGSKKDFYDLYELLKTRKVEELVGYYKEKFNQDNPLPLVKSLNYFEDAEQKGISDVISLNDSSWGEIKNEIDKCVKEYIRVQSSVQ